MASDPSGRPAGDASLAPPPGPGDGARPADPSSDRPAVRRPDQVANLRAQPASNKDPDVEPVRPARRRGPRSIWLRLLLPVLVAAVGLVALGAEQSLAAVRLANQGGRAQTVVATALATVKLEYQLEREIAEADALRQRGGTAGATLLTAAQEQTDLAVADFETASRTAIKATPAMQPLLDSAAAQVDRLTATRAQVTALPASQLSAASYRQITEALIAVADALPQQISDPTLSTKARALVAVAVDLHLGAQERDLLRGVFRRGAYAGTELSQLATLVGAQQERRAEFGRSASTAQRTSYEAHAATPDAVSAASLLAGALASPAQLNVDPDVWFIAQSNALRQQQGLQSQLARELNQAALGQQSIAQTKAVVTAVSTAGLLILALGAALLLAVRTSRRLRRLRSAAQGIAVVDLPNAINTLTAARDVAGLRGAVQEATSRADVLVVPGADEITEVGLALTQLHRQALRLAAEQATLRLDVADLFVALSRRGQTLIQRQLRLIDDFERVETDPHRLARLFALDHLAARMRRNEENLLVLAGGEPGRQVTAVVPLVDLVRAAAAEIEDFDRVDPSGVADVGIVPYTARDLIHLLAELLENATFFSPPASRVRVTARRSIDGVQVSVYDTGIGMPPAQLEEINQRLARPATLTAELAGTMGLLVVSRLAARHDISVRLRSSHRGGTVALVELPNVLLAPAPSLTEHTAALLRRQVTPVNVVEGELLLPTQELPVAPVRVTLTGHAPAPVNGSTDPVQSDPATPPRTPAHSVDVRAAETVDLPPGALFHGGPPMVTDARAAAETDPRPAGRPVVHPRRRHPRPGRRGLARRRARYPRGARLDVHR